jgi:hypothetical protein
MYDLYMAAVHSNGNAIKYMKDTSMLDTESVYYICMAAIQENPVSMRYIMDLTDTRIQYKINEMWLFAKKIYPDVVQEVRNII